ncbi:MAG TPA: hypothetical protein VHF92_02635 [Geodermatophilus sp.]|nr:hypothetical protein [Geodermatophilus sp.]
MSRPSPVRPALLGRAALVLGGAAALALTPPFALAYHRAYGLADERPPGWLAALSQPLQGLGLLRGAPVATYDGYGTAYAAALLLVPAGLVLVLRHRPTAGRAEAAGWWLVGAGLAVTVAGTVADYAFPDDSAVARAGFSLELLGFLLAAVGTVVVGVALHRAGRVGPVVGAVLAAVGPASLVLGTWAVGHIPSGTGSLLMAAAVAAGLRGLPAGAGERCAPGTTFPVEK